MEVRIQTLPSYHVAYLRHVGPYASGGIPETWERFGQWCSGQGLMAPRRTMLGISHDNPHTTAPEHCRYDACIEVAADFAVSGEIGLQTVPGGPYACVDFRGDALEIGAAWQWFATEWMAQSAYAFDNRPCFELYPAEMDCLPEPGIFACVLCIPVKPK